MVREIDFSLQETNSSWQPHSAKWDGVLSLASGEGSTWPCSAPDQPLTDCTEGSEKYFWNRSRESYTHLQSEFTDKACWCSLLGASCKSGTWIQNHECPSQCPGGDTWARSHQVHKTPPGRPTTEFLEDAAALFIVLPKIPKWQLSFPLHEGKASLPH